MAVTLTVVLGLLLLLPSVGATQPGGSGGAALIERGRYLVTIMDCGGCHTPGALAGKPDSARGLAGSDIGFGGPFGVVYPKNLTPDAETGLGAWTEAEIDRAVRRGQSRDGRPLVPIMPWPSYGVLSDADARAVSAYLKSLPPVRFAVPKDLKPGERPTAPYLMLVEPK
jgi:mono/diheme cytochrome c family protein